MKFAKLALRDLARNPRRSLITMGSIAVSLFVFSSLMSLATITDQILGSAGGSQRLVCHSKAGFGHGLPEAYGPKIRALPHVEALSGWNFFGSQYQRPGDGFPTIDLDVEDLDVIWPEWGLKADELARANISEGGFASFGARVGKHDDLVRALAIACWQLFGPRGFSVTQVDALL